jgi:hypothetical protein
MNTITAIAITSPVNATIPADRLAVSVAAFERLATEHLGALRVPQTDLEVDAETDALDDALRAVAMAAVTLLDDGAWVLLSGRSQSTPGADRWIRVEASDWMAID